MTEPIHIVPHSDAEAQLWRTTAEIARLFADWPWVLVGGLMVALLEREHGGSKCPGRRSMSTH